MTRLGLFSQRVIETGWLLAVVLVPLYFDVFTTRVFEPDKLTLLRSITLVMLLAQVVLLIENRRQAGIQPSRQAQSLRQVISKDFLLASIAAYGLVYLLTSLTSIDPAVSLWGSHPRLQGFYSVVSYLTVFALIVANMRRMAQVSRLVTVMTLTGLPAALYGVLQASGNDPLPWGGDVTVRVSSTMGNPIFIGAFMIVVLTLAIGRALGGRMPDATENIDQTAFWRALAAIVGANLLLALLVAINRAMPPLWFTYPALLSLFAGLMVWAHEQLRRAAAWQIGVLFGAVAGFEFLCLVLSQSRGPFIGLVVGMVAFALLWAWQTRNRTLISGSIGALALIAAFLVVFNLPDSPLAPLRSIPHLDRFGQLSDLDSGTGRVRILIWQGTRELITTWPQVGLEPDPYQSLRPLLGYGPETMAYAANRVYQPELGQLEARTASPDRNHNDTLDHLVMTGLIGLLAYLVALAAVLRAGLKLVAVETSFSNRMMFISFMSALVAHLVEVQVGIAIAATLTYFWAIAGLIYVSNRWAVSRTKAMVAEAGRGGGYAGQRPSPQRPSQPDATTGGSRRQ